MGKFTGYKCSKCGQDYQPDEITYTCPKDGGNLDVVLDYDAIRQKLQPEDLTSRAEDSLWCYLPLFPVPDPGGEAAHRRAGRVDDRLRPRRAVKTCELPLEHENRVGRLP